MRRILLIAAAVFAVIKAEAQQVDTLWLSTAFTTHIIFATDLTYADLSNSSVIAAKIIEQNRNMLALKARSEFSESASVSALESNGRMHTYIVRYCPNPTELVIDTRRSTRSDEGHADAATGDGVSLTRKGDAPLLSEVVEGKQRLFHVGDDRYDILAMCEEIMSYSDITYIVLSLHNGSSVSYETEDATFVIESKKRGRRTVKMEKTIFPRNRYGTLRAAPGTDARIAYSFDKMTLSKDQVLKVYLYETAGQRNLEMTIDTKDINKAKSGR